jgi:hypothetical protein
MSRFRACCTAYDWTGCSAEPDLLALTLFQPPEDIADEHDAAD